MIMGGKGGGGGPSYEDSLAQINPTYMKEQYEKEKPKFASEEAFYKNYGIDPAGMRPGSTLDDPEYQFSKDVFTKVYGNYKPPAPAPAPAAAAPVAAPAPAAAAAPAPAAAPTAAPAATTAPIGAGDVLTPPNTPSVTGQGLGDQLAATTANADAGAKQYWIGGIDSSRNTRRGGGSLKTTQT
jgi:hypothetical protein